MIKISPISRCEGTLNPPPDKSISHRALFLSSMASGISEIKNLSWAEDVQTTWKVLKSLGRRMDRKEGIVSIEGGRFNNKGDFFIDCRNSGTTARVLMGLLAPENLSVKITGDDSLIHRPMERIISPLKSMGANISYLDRFGYLPVALKGEKLHGIHYELPIASAQVKTSLLLAALHASGKSIIVEPVRTRDHTERMLTIMEADMDISRTKNGSKIHIGPSGLYPLKMSIPGDFSSAAYFIALSAVRPGKGLTVRNVNLNPTRLGFLETLKEMGAEITIEMKDVMPEPIGTIIVKGGDLKAVSIKRERIPSMIDEVPLLAVIATQVKGQTLIRGAEELKVKEANRISSLAEGLRKMGARIEPADDGFIVEGPTPLQGASLHSHGDHRMAMCFAVAAALAQSDSHLKGESCVSISYPRFFQDFHQLAPPKICV